LEKRKEGKKEKRMKKKIFSLWRKRKEGKNLKNRKKSARKGES